MPNAKVHIGSQIIDADARGYYRVELDPGEYQVYASVEGLPDSPITTISIISEIIRADLIITAPGYDVVFKVLTYLSTKGETGIAGTTVTLSNGRQGTTVTTSGLIKIEGVVEGTYTYSVSMPGFDEVITGSVSVGEGEETTIIYFDPYTEPGPGPYGELSGSVYTLTVDSERVTIPGAFVVIGSSNVTLTNADGEYSIIAGSGTYDIAVSANGYISETITVSIIGSETVTTEHELTRIDGEKLISPPAMQTNNTNYYVALTVLAIIGGIAAIMAVKK